MSKGLGDMVEQVMKITGIKKIVEYFFESCDCDERKEWLNKQSKRFKKEFDCLTKSEFLYLSGIFELKQKDFDILEQQKLIDIHNRIYNTNLKTSSCNSCLKEILETLKTLYKSYE